MTIFIYSVETVSRILMFFWDSYKNGLLINLKCYEMCVCHVCVVCVCVCVCARTHTNWCEFMCKDACVWLSFR